MIPKPKQAFTLVEILVVIFIIGILSAIAVPAVMRAIGTGKNTALKLEVESLSRAVDMYLEQYGDYPPDGSSKDVLDRHMRKLFQRMSEPDVTLLNRLVDDSIAGDATGNFSAVAMDRAEALVFFLGGFSKDLQHPITGPGGPLEFKDFEGDGDVTNLNNYQYNVDRVNSLFDFDQSRLTIGRIDTSQPLRLVSTDESEYGYNLAAHGGVDLLPAYRAGGDEDSPIVYFDSRTYGLVAASTYNGYASGNSTVGGVRPYKSEINAKPPQGSDYGSEANAFAAIPFHNPNTFQIISPGRDGVFGAVVATTGSPALPVHWVTESGRPVQPLQGASSAEDLVYTDSSLGSRGYQDRDWNSSISVNGNLDNVTNFTQAATLEGELQ